MRTVFLVTICLLACRNGQLRSGSRQADWRASGGHGWAVAWGRYFSEKGYGQLFSSGTARLCVSVKELASLGIRYQEPMPGEIRRGHLWVAASKRGVSRAIAFSLAGQAWRPCVDIRLPFGGIVGLSVSPDETWLLGEFSEPSGRTFLARFPLCAPNSPLAYNVIKLGRQEEVRGYPPDIISIGNTGEVWVSRPAKHSCWQLPRGRMVSATEAVFTDEGLRFIDLKGGGDHKEVVEERPSGEIERSAIFPFADAQWLSPIVPDASGQDLVFRRYAHQDTLFSWIPGSTVFLSLKDGTSTILKDANAREVLGFGPRS